MRVLRIITTIEPEAGGPSFSAVNAAVAESQAGVETTMVSTTDPAVGGDPIAAARGRLEAAGVRCISFRRIPALSEVARRWGLSFSFAAWIVWNVRRFDVVHVHYVWGVGPVLGVLAGVMFDRPIVMTAHESLTRFDIAGSRSAWRRRQKVALRRALLRGIDRVIAASDMEMRDSVDDPSQAVVIPHPVVESAAAEAASAGDGDRSFTVAFLGRLHPKKNVPVLLRAFGAMPDTSRLIIAGSGPPEYRDSLRLQAHATGADDRIEWWGFLDSDGKARLFADADVLVMPSAYECFGMVAAEAMAAGLPVIVSATSGVADVVDRYSAGLVVQSGDAGALAAALTALMRRDDLVLAGEGARRAAHETFSFEAYGRAALSVYSSLTSSVPSDPVQA